jgi:hypothetical protein
MREALSIRRFRSHFHVLDRRPGYAEIAVTAALFLASTTTAYAAGTIGTADIKDAAVTHVKLAANAVNSGNVATNTITLSDIKGVDVKGSISFNIAAQRCVNLAMGVGGAVAGQAGFLTWTGTPPPGIVLGPLQIIDSQALTVACNLSTTAASVSNAGVRIITFS